MPGAQEHYERLLADIAEGARLHYEVDEDRDLALLQGDQMYARGLARLAELGDLDATAELADVISLVAQARAAGDAELAAAVWAAGSAAVRWGSTPQYEEAKTLARLGASGATRALTEAAASGGPRTAQG